MLTLVRLPLVSAVALAALLALVALKAAHTSTAMKLETYEWGLILVSGIAGVLIGGLLCV